MEKRLLTTREAAEFIGISHRTIYNQMSKDEFPIKPKRFGRKLLWDRKDLERYAESRD